jgi:hypothetical protein
MWFKQKNGNGTEPWLDKARAQTFWAGQEAGNQNKNKTKQPAT